MTFRTEQIGDCTLILGDCLEVIPTLGRFDSIISDVPYGTNNNSSWGGLHGDCKIQNDETLEIRDEMLQIADFERALIFGSPKKAKPAGTRQTIIWDKGGHCGMGDLSIPWKPNYEEIYILGTGFVGKRTSGIISIISDGECNGVVRERNHPTEKPLQLMIELVKKTPGMILDPFLGSGTTLVACAKLGRRGIGIELEEKYFDIAVKRVKEAYEQPDLFLPERPKEQKTDDMFRGAEK